VAQYRRLDPCRYVGGLLLWQGATWLALAAAGLGLWIATLPGAIGPASGEAGMLWRCGELVAIAVGAGLGVTQVSMACRLRGGPRLLRALVHAVQGVTAAAGLVVIAISLIVASSTVVLVALTVHSS
jgi:hypothetical protein